MSKLLSSSSASTLGESSETSLTADIENFIHDDAQTLVHHFKDSWNKCFTKLHRANVLIAGITGAGKSSIINTVFGRQVAAEGTGRPITQHFMRFAPEDKPLVLYDSKGLETGIAEDCLRETRQFFEEHQFSNDGSSENCIHCVWYVVNSAASRFHPFEETLCRELFADYPIVFIVSKSDITSNEDKAALKECIENMNLPNVLGIFFTCSAKYAKTKPPDTCARCGSDDIITYKKKRMNVCESCGYSEVMIVSTGLELVVDKTLEALPIVARDAFISAQNISFSHKDQRAKSIVREFHDECKRVHLTGSLLSHMAKMLTRLSILWDFREHGHLYGTQIAKDMLTGLNLRDRVFLFMHKNRHQTARATAFGLLWNRCVRNLSKRMFHDCIEENLTPEEVEAGWPQCLLDTFSILKEEMLDAMERDLEELGLTAILEREMPTAVERTGVHATFQPSLPSSGVSAPAPIRLSNPQLDTSILLSGDDQDSDDSDDRIHRMDSLRGSSLSPPLDATDRDLSPTRSEGESSTHRKGRHRHKDRDKSERGSSHHSSRKHKNPERSTTSMSMGSVHHSHKKHLRRKSTPSDINGDYRRKEKHHKHHKHSDHSTNNVFGKVIGKILHEKSDSGSEPVA